jgi:hypothetical protein
MGFSPARSAQFIVLTASILAAAVVACAHGQKANPDTQVITDFNDRIKAYLDLRDKVDGDAVPLKETKDAAKIEAAQKTLAALIQKARATARQGDIFSPAIEKKFRSLLKWEATGPDGAKTKAAILEEKPMVELKVNAEYPQKEPLATVPPNVLQTLPALPKDQGLEYRFVRKHMIVDFVYNALP